VKQELLTNNPCRGVERNETVSRERVLSDAEVPLFWQSFSETGLIGEALKVLLLTGQRPGEVAHMRHEHIADGWWTMPGMPDAKWPGTKNAQTHRVWLPQAVQEILAQLGYDETGYVFGTPPEMAGPMRSTCKDLSIPRATPHDLRRTHGTTVTALGFGRDATDKLNALAGEGNRSTAFTARSFLFEQGQQQTGCAVKMTPETLCRERW
jgi:integrase